MSLVNEFWSTKNDDTRCKYLKDALSIIYLGRKDFDDVKKYLCYSRDNEMSEKYLKELRRFCIRLYARLIFVQLIISVFIPTSLIIIICSLINIKWLILPLSIVSAIVINLISLYRMVANSKKAMKFFGYHAFKNFVTIM